GSYALPGNDLPAESETHRDDIDDWPKCPPGDRPSTFGVLMQAVKLLKPPKAVAKAIEFIEEADCIWELSERLQEALQDPEFRDWYSKATARSPTPAPQPIVAAAALRQEVELLAAAQIIDQQRDIAGRGSVPPPKFLQQQVLAHLVQTMSQQQHISP